MEVQELNEVVYSTQENSYYVVINNVSIKISLDAHETLKVMLLAGGAKEQMSKTKDDFISITTK